MLGTKRIVGSFTVAAALMAHSGVGAFAHPLHSVSPTGAVEKVVSNALALRLQQGNERAGLIRL